MSAFNATLIGKGIVGSISPQIHEEIFRILKSRHQFSFTSINYSVTECDEKCDFAAWLKTAPTNGTHAANITIPYKDTAFELSMARLGVSAALRSANALSLNGGITAFSTDGDGFVSALSRHYLQFNLEHYHLISIGAGSTARAILYAMCTRWMPQSLTIVNRTRSNADELAEFCIAQAPGPTVRVMEPDEFIATYEEPHYRFVLQATPIGNSMHHGNLTEGFSWHETDFAADVTYNPLQTQFLQQAHNAGAKTMNGLGMLVEQAAMAQYYWLMGSLPEQSPLTDDEYHYLLRKFGS